MKIKTGCDLVKISNFGRSAENGGEAFFERIFSKAELSEAQSLESRAGVFAAKEAVIKALDWAGGSWRDVEILKSDTGRPEVKVDGDFVSMDVSISHSEEYAMATVVFLIEEN